MNDTTIKGLDDAEVTEALARADKGDLWRALMRAEYLLTGAAMGKPGGKPAWRQARQALCLNTEQWKRIITAEV